MAADCNHEPEFVEIETANEFQTSLYAECFRCGAEMRCDLPHTMWAVEETEDEEEEDDD